MTHPATLTLDQADEVIRSAVCKVIDARHEHDRADAAQKAWEQLLPYWPRPEVRTEPYVWTVAKRAAQRHMAGLHALAPGAIVPFAEEQEDGEGGAIVAADDRSEPSFELTRAERLVVLDNAMKLLQPRPRTMLVLKYLQGLSSLDLARVLEIDGDPSRVQNIVNSALTRAKDRLRSLLPELGTLGGRGNRTAVTLFDEHGHEVPFAVRDRVALRADASLCLRPPKSALRPTLTEGWAIVHLFDPDGGCLRVTTGRRLHVRPEEIVLTVAPDLPASHRVVRVFLFEGPWFPGSERDPSPWLIPARESTGPAAS
ncbi:MAG: sigma-70 family RNA polymerase sigma factor [Planctomycetota bacterium]